jgi:hypothetical protein
MVDGGVGMVRASDRDGIRFATWVGHGRDPEVAYLDDTQLVIGSAELTIHGWLLLATGKSHNVLGGVVEGPLDPAVLHRIAHTVLDREGAPWFRLDGPDDACGDSNELCEMARRTPHLSLPYHEPGSFHLASDFALQWVTWGDPGRSGVLRRAVYVDDRYLVEAGLGPDDQIRIWPARGLRPFDLELVTPTARESAKIEDRVSQTTRPR